MNSAPQEYRSSTRASDVAPELRPIARGGPLLVSYMQEDQWFTQEARPNDASYNMAYAVRFRGPLLPAALARAVCALVERHEMLRTRFTAGETGVRQIIDAPRPVSLPIVDLRGLPGAAAASCSQRVAAAVTLRRFDLRAEWPFRLALLRLQDQEHVLVLVVHHIAGDGWSMSVLFRELGALYSAFSAGRPPALPPLTVQYADYAAWEREYLQGDRLERLLAYWTEQMSDAPGLRLPTDRASPVVDYRGAAHRFALRKELVGALQRVAVRSRTSLFAVLLAALKTLLWRYSGDTQILVSSPNANRARADLQDVVGFFATWLVLRTDLAGASTFRDVLERVRKVIFRALAQPALPPLLLRTARPSLPDRPFRVALALDPAIDLGHPRMTLCESIFALLPVPRGGVDLRIVMTQDGDSLEATASYNLEALDPPVVDRIVADYVDVLERVAVDPELALSKVVYSLDVAPEPQEARRDG